MKEEIEEAFGPIVGALLVTYCRTSQSSYGQWFDDVDKAYDEKAEAEERGDYPDLHIFRASQLAWMVGSLGGGKGNK